jgi:hypothetical protein
MTMMTKVTSSFLGYHLYSAVIRMYTFGMVSFMQRASQLLAYQMQRKLILSRT